MLVLALQFSKGIAGVGTIAVSRDGGDHRTRRGSGARELVPCAEGLDMVQLPQNGREDKVDRFDFERSKPRFRILTTDPPMHQLGTGSNRTGRMPAND
jgi:hypothetical protein